MKQRKQHRNQHQIQHRNSKQSLVVSIEAKVPVVEKNKQKGRYLWGKDDNLPAELLNAISDSGTAMNCVSKLKTFIYGTGFVDEGDRGFMVNPEQNANALLADLSPGLGIFEAIAVRVLYRIDGNPGSVYRVPIKTLRKSEDGRWIYNVNKGKKDFKQNEDVYFRAFTPNVSAQDRQNIIHDEISKYGYQLGEILVEFQIKEVEGGDIYPIPDAYSGIEDIRTDASLQRLEKSNVDDGLKSSAIILLPGQVDDSEPDGDGLTAKDYLKEDIKEFTRPDGGKKVLIIEGQGTGEAAKVEPFSIADTLNGTAEIRDRVPRFVCRHLKTPPPLVGFSEPAMLGNTTALYNSLKIFMLAVSDCQQMATRVFKRIYPAGKWNIGKANLIEDLPPEVLSKLTDDELRKLGGYEPIEKKQSSESELILNALNTLSPLVANEVLKSLTDDEKRALIGMKPKLINNG